VQPLDYGIVLSSTATHAYWNFLLKRSRGGSVFVALSKVAEAVLLAPAFIWLYARAFPIGQSTWGLVIVGALLVLFNYASLARAYASGDLSLVYPISRAGILFFLPLFGFVVFRERLSAGGWTALVVIVVGIVVSQLPDFTLASLRALAPRLRSESVGFALAAALFAAIYTVWDKRAIQRMPSFAYFYAYTTIVAIVYMAFVWRRQTAGEVRVVWQSHWSSIVQVGLFNSVTYLLVLIALRNETSSYVVAIRQLSIVWGVLLGRLVLGEAVGRPKQVGIALLLIGCAMVALVH
jgi:drug/metabolite transporter (DMT)-like permease